jgi:hypothetical protein
VDGARTRDPRRDRVGDQTSIHAGLRLVCYSKDCRFRTVFARYAPALFQSFHRPDGRTRADGTSKTDLDRSLIERWRRGQDFQPEVPSRRGFRRLRKCLLCGRLNKLENWSFRPVAELRRGGPSVSDVPIEHPLVAGAARQLTIPRDGSPSHCRH